jgi:Sec-independent protein secretion pathway component TatC
MSLYAECRGATQIGPFLFVDTPVKSRRLFRHFVGILWTFLGILKFLRAFLQVFLQAFLEYFSSTKVAFLLAFLKPFAGITVSIYLSIFLALLVAFCDKVCQCKYSSIEACHVYKV